MEYLTPNYEKRPPEDKGSAMDTRNTQEFYRINYGQEVTNEEWLDYR